jgi:ribonucleoside-diphosphate reductase alpha chain
MERPETLEGRTWKTRTGFGNVYVTVNFLDDKPFEVFVSTGKCGQSVMAKAEAIGRLVSIALRNGVSAKDLARQLVGISGDKPEMVGGDLVLSIPDAVGRILAKIPSACSLNEPKEDQNAL